LVDVVIDDGKPWIVTAVNDLATESKRSITLEHSANDGLNG